MDDNIFSIIILLLESILFYYMPMWNGKNTLFGLVLKEDDFQRVGVSLLMEKPTGLGYTFNFAHKRILLYGGILFVSLILLERLRNQCKVGC